MKRLTNNQMLEMLLEDDESENGGTDISDSGSDYSPSDDEDEDNITDSSDDSSDSIPADDAVALDTVVAEGMAIAPDAAVSLYCC